MRVTLWPQNRENLLNEKEKKVKHKIINKSDFILKTVHQKTLKKWKQVIDLKICDTYNQEGLISHTELLQITEEKTNQ